MLHAVRAGGVENARHVAVGCRVAGSSARLEIRLEPRLCRSSGSSGLVRHLVRPAERETPSLCLGGGPRSWAEAGVVSCSTDRRAAPFCRSCPHSGHLESRRVTSAPRLLSRAEYAYQTATSPGLSSDVSARFRRRHDMARRHGPGPAPPRISLSGALTVIRRPSLK